MKDRAVLRVIKSGRPHYRNLRLFKLINYTMTNTNRGSATMDEQKQRQQTAQSGQSSGKENNPGNFANDPKRASEAGREGGKNSKDGGRS